MSADMQLPDGDRDVEKVLAEHAGVNLTAAWKGSPDSKNPRNIRRICLCGEVIGQLPYPMARLGKKGSFSLAGDPFDEPHRAHIAEVLTALGSQPAQSGDGVVIGREDLRAMAIELGRHAARWRNPRATSQLMNRVFVAITGQQPTTTEETNE